MKPQDSKHESPPESKTGRRQRGKPGPEEAPPSEVASNGHGAGEDTPEGTPLADESERLTAEEPTGAKGQPQRTATLERATESPKRGAKRTAAPAEAELPGVPAEPGLAEQETKSHWLDRPVLRGVPLRWELALYLLLLGIGVFIHFWDLGSRALHHDESLHAVYSWYLYSGRGYRHDPMMHGPWQYHAIALIYFLFGATDYTARILPAICGTILIGVPYFLRDRLGRYGALVAAAMLTISPSILYYGRFVREDIYTLLFHALLAVFLWRYLASPRPRYLYGAALMIALGFAEKETTYITVTIFGFFFLFASGRQWIETFFGKDRRPFAERLRSLNPIQDVLLTIGLLSLPQMSAGIELPLQALGVNLSQQVGSFFGLPITVMAVAGFVTVSALLAITLYVGHLWKGRVWWQMVAFFYVPYALFYTTFLSNPPGFASGIWGSLDYWLAQHEVQRGNQPIYYYLVLMPIYEFLPIILGIGAFVTYLFRRRSLFTLFLIWWFVTALVGYSYAGEKMPWLVIHIVFPLILLAARYYGEVLGRLDWSAFRSWSGWLLLGLAPLTVLALIVVLRGNAGQGGRSMPEVLALALIVAALVGLTWQVASTLQFRTALRIIGLAGVLALSLFTIRAAWQASFYNGDTPVEMLVYTQTSPAIPRIMQDIEEIARRTGEGKNLRITVDSTESFTWPWAWYLREYPNVDYPALSTMTAPPRGQVLLLHATNESRARPFLTQYGPGQRYPHRWWFPEDTYRNLDLGKFLGLVVQPSTWEKWWNYFYRRDPGQSLGSTDAIAYYPREAGVLSAVPPQLTPEVDLSTKQAELQPSLVVGSTGSGPGQLLEPKAIAAAPDGGFYVLDSGNARVVRYDAQGRQIASWGSKGEGPGQFATEFGGAWGIAVDPAGNVYVVDTWNHRIQKFTAEGQHLATFGGGLTDNLGQAQGNEGKFYGPRGIAIDQQGNVYVTDTGNHRVQKLSNDGQFLGSFGGRGVDAGTFNEPVGIAVDEAGNIYVADTWNQRIQKFDPSFRPIQQISVPGWEGQSLVNKPGISVAQDGTLLAVDPESARIFKLNNRGEIEAVYGRFGPEPGALDLPMGIAVDRQGNALVVESGNSRVQRFSIGDRTGAQSQPPAASQPAESVPSQPADSAAGQPGASGGASGEAAPQGEAGQPAAPPPPPGQ